MKIHSFALILVALAVLSSGSYAQSLDSKTIGGTEFTLLSNTDQCLANCEAWIEWDLAFKPTDVDVLNSGIGQFKLDLATKENSKGLSSYGVEVWQDVLVDVDDYCFNEEPYSVPKNGKSCEAMFCKDGKVEGNCDCVSYSYDVCGSHKELKRVMVSDNFFNFKALAGNKYYLRVWGNKKASLEENSVDWIPTFFGEKVSQWAWWDNDWGYKKKITLKTDAYLAWDTTTDLAIPITQNAEDTSFWANVNADGSDVRFVNAAEDAELDFHFEDFDTLDQNMLAWVEVTDTFTSGANVEIYMYYGNAGASDAQDIDGTYPAIYTAVWDFNETSGTMGQDLTDNGYNLTHTNTPDLDVNGLLDGAITYKRAESERSSNTTLFDGGLTELTISFWWMKKGGWNSAEANDNVAIYKANAAGNLIYSLWSQATGAFIWRLDTGAVTHSISSAKVDWAANQWYHIVGTFSSTTNDMNLYVDGNLSSGGTLSEAMDALGAGVTDDFYIASEGGANYSDANVDAFHVFDGTVLNPADVNVLYYSQKGELQEVGPEVERGTDINVTSVEGYEFDFTGLPFFTETIDGNLTIGWSFFQPSNNRSTVDINYTDANSGSYNTYVIVKDLNMDSTVCTDQDWDDVPSTCYWDWNLSGVSDGNYYLFIESSLDVDDFADENFGIITDVNLIINVPLNEDTGESVVTPAMGYSVKITTPTDIRFYDNLAVDLNGYTVPLGTPILIKIDVNVADQYYSRQYNYQFDTAVGSETLQPYLAPVSKSGNFIFYVFNSTTTAPLEDVTINVTGIVPDTGTTEIQEITTDSAGTATIPLLLGTDYTVTFTYNGELVYSVSLVPTAASLYYQVGLDIGETVPEPEPTGGLYVEWLPTTLFLLQEPTGGVDINASITLIGKTLGTMRIRIFDTNGCLYDDNSFGGTWEDGNIVVFNVDLNKAGLKNIYTNTACIFDTNTNLYSIYVQIDVNATDGNQYHSRSINWQVVQLDNYQWNVWYRLGITANALNAPGSVVVTSVIAFFVMFLVIVAASKVSGNTFFSAVVGLMVLGLFVYWGWFLMTAFAFICVGTIIIAFFYWGKDK